MATRLRKRRSGRQTSTHQIRLALRIMLGAVLIIAGAAHLSWSRSAFQAQVPNFVPMDPDTVVILSGVVEIALGMLLLSLRRRWIGWIAGAFFVAVFPGNIAQYVHHRDAFGLDTDNRRAIRLLFQPILVAWAIWSTE